ncbi:hypothetical protein GW915_00745 [bacterium]|nr:hypothetical protein [bacterium]
MALPNKVKEKLSALLVFVKPSRERLIVCTMQVTILFSLGVAGWASYQLYSKLFHSSHAPHVEHASGVEYDTSQVVGLGESHIPKDILARQDGQEEEGHDLGEHEADEGRGLASLIDVDGEVVVSSGPLFYDFAKVAAGLKREDNNIEAIVEADLSFEMDGRGARAELEARRIEFKALLESIIGEFSKDELMTTKGKYDLKRHIMSQLNFRMKSGQVVDVLYSNFRIQ